MQRLGPGRDRLFDTLLNGAEFSTSIDMERLIRCVRIQICSKII